MSSSLPSVSSLPSNSAYTRHVQKCLQYVHFYGGSAPKLPKGKTERDVLEESFEFIRDDEHNDEGDDKKGLAKRYYDSLFREYALVDLSRYREGQIALRWRTKQEVLNGTGHFTCASLHCSHHTETEVKLETLEMNFAYVEKETQKNALVKVRLCERCARKVGKVNRDRGAGRHRDKHWSRSWSRDGSGSRSRRHEERRLHRDSDGSHDEDRRRSRKEHGRDGSHDPRGYSSRRKEEREYDSDGRVHSSRRREEREYDSDGRRSRRDKHASRDERPSRHDDERRSRKHRSRSPAE